STSPSRPTLLHCRSRLAAAPLLRQAPLTHARSVSRPSARAPLARLAAAARAQHGRRPALPTRLHGHAARRAPDHCRHVWQLGQQDGHSQRRCGARGRSTVAAGTDTGARRGRAALEPLHAPHARRPLPRGVRRAGVVLAAGQVQQPQLERGGWAARPGWLVVAREQGREDGGQTTQRWWRAARRFEGRAPATRRSAAWGRSGAEETHLYNSFRALIGSHCI
ncbi:hypothetical protein FA09DRAFT_360090, partial [Tilletiopsis washingtonensis]